MLVHILTETKANAAGCGAVNLDAKILHRLLTNRLSQEFMRVIDAVGMRETIA
jgi:hypothetical protein